jgi:hypothetical protein
LNQKRQLEQRLKDGDVFIDDQLYSSDGDGDGGADDTLDPFASDEGLDLEGAAAIVPEWIAAKEGADGKFVLLPTVAPIGALWPRDLIVGRIFAPFVICVHHETTTFAELEEWAKKVFPEVLGLVPLEQVSNLE